MTLDTEHHGGCGAFIGLVVVSIAGGCIWGEAWGWLILGGTLVAFGLINKFKGRL